MINKISGLVLVSLLSLIAVGFTTTTSAERTNCGDEARFDYTRNIFLSGVNQGGWHTEGEAIEAAFEHLFQFILLNAQASGVSCESNTCEHNGGAGYFSCREWAYAGQKVWQMFTTTRNLWTNKWFVTIHFHGQAGVNCDDCPPVGTGGPIPL